MEEIQKDKVSVTNWAVGVRSDNEAGFLMKNEWD